METKNLSSATHKCVLVIDNAQPTGIVANIASVLSMTLGCKVNNIVSHDVYDKQGEKHLGITQLPIPILGASQEEIKNIDEIMECYSTGGIYDFFIKVVLKDLDAYNQFVFEKLTKVHGIIKMQSSFVLSEIKHTTVLNIDK